MTTCTRCDDCRWVCEAHPDRPWGGPHACACHAAGVPRPICNPSVELTPPQLPHGLFDDDGTR
jgi:hypothetical protein